MLTIETSIPSAQIVGAPCVNGVVPLNPYIVNCNLPTRGPRVPGQAPDAGAIIACRGVPACLSYYVNYPGQTIWGPFTPAHDGRLLPTSRDALRSRITNVRRIPRLVGSAV